MCANEQDLIRAGLQNAYTRIAPAARAGGVGGAWAAQSGADRMLKYRAAAAAVTFRVASMADARDACSRARGACHVVVAMAPQSTRRECEAMCKGKPNVHRLLVAAAPPPANQGAAVGQTRQQAPAPHSLRTRAQAAQRGSASANANRTAARGGAAHTANLNAGQTDGHTPANCTRDVVDRDTYLCDNCGAQVLSQFQRRHQAVCRAVVASKEDAAATVRERERAKSGGSAAPSALSGMGVAAAAAGSATARPRVKKVTLVRGSLVEPFGFELVFRQDTTSWRTSGDSRVFVCRIERHGLVTSTGIAK